MPFDRLAVRIPERCQYCGGERTVKIEQSIHGGSVQPMWRCSRCNEAWALSEDEQSGGNDRRVGVSDRRRSTRGDRRQH